MDLNKLSNFICQLQIFVPTLFMFYALSISQLPFFFAFFPGKYVVRLYHCGKWRMIIVDDRLPVDVDDNILVPIIRKENLIELWPALLAKAILKLNSCKQLATPEFYAGKFNYSVKIVFCFITKDRNKKYHS